MILPTTLASAKHGLLADGRACTGYSSCPRVDNVWDSDVLLRHPSSTWIAFRCLCRCCVGMIQPVTLRTLLVCAAQCEDVQSLQ